MKQIAIVYYSESGNTLALAKAIKKGIEEVGSTAKLITAGIFSKDMLDSYDGFAFGCPAHGSENLEESTFEPMFNAVLPHLRGRSVLLFGSYGWGDGQWMVEWAQNVANHGAIHAATPIIAMDYPKEEHVLQAFEAGKTLGS